MSHEQIVRGRMRWGNTNSKPSKLRDKTHYSIRGVMKSA